MNNLDRNDRVLPTLVCSPGGHEFGYLVLLAGRAVQYAVDEAAADANIPATDLLVLYALHVHDGLTGSMVARLLHLQQSSITGLADRTEASGLVCRVRDETDRRRIWLCLTDRGEAVLRRCGVRVRSSVQAHFEPLTVETAQQIATLLGSVVEPWLADVAASGGRK